MLWLFVDFTSGEDTNTFTVQLASDAIKAGVQTDLCIKEQSFML